MRTLLALGALAIGTGLMGRAFGLRSPVFMGSEVALLAFILVVYRYLLPLIDRHDRGAGGEELVGGLLDMLPASQWRVLHDASFGRGDVDHIAIGPPGVFTVETKSHPGPISVKRLHGRLLRQADAQRRMVASLLEGESGGQRGVALPCDVQGDSPDAPAQRANVAEVPLEALVVYSRAWVDRPLARRKGVRVLPARMLIGYLRQLPERIDGARRDAAYADLLAAAREPAGARGSVRAGVPARTRSHA